jgi:hypothetical protein
VTITASDAPISNQTKSRVPKPCKYRKSLPRSKTSASLIAFRIRSLRKTKKSLATFTSSAVFAAVIVEMSQTT